MREKMIVGLFAAGLALTLSSEAFTQGGGGGGAGGGAGGATGGATGGSTGAGATGTNPGLSAIPVPQTPPPAHTKPAQLVRGQPVDSPGGRDWNWRGASSGASRVAEPRGRGSGQAGDQAGDGSITRMPCS